MFICIHPVFSRRLPNVPKQYPVYVCVLWGPKTSVRPHVLVSENPSGGSELRPPSHHLTINRRPIASLRLSKRLKTTDSIPCIYRNVFLLKKISFAAQNHPLVHTGSVPKSNPTPPTRPPARYTRSTQVHIDICLRILHAGLTS
jgi:hypothetical protein